MLVVVVVLVAECSKKRIPVAECSKKRIPRPYRSLHGHRGAARDPLPSVGVHIVIVDCFGVGNRLPHALQQLQRGGRTLWSFGEGEGGKGRRKEEEKEEEEEEEDVFLPAPPCRRLHPVRRAF
jgi:hypothetical protein